MNFESIDAGLYLNITFFSVLGLATLFGFLKGFKKSLIGFLVNLAFYLVFFLTLDMVVGLLWSYEFAPLGGYIAQVLPGFPTTVSSVSGAVDAAIMMFAPDSISVDLANPQLVALITGIGQFAIKLVYAVIYFTIGYLLFAIVGMIIKALFASRGKYDKKYGSQNRGLGAVFGLLQGAVAVFVMMITFGGLVSVSESLLTLIPEGGLPEDVNYEFTREDLYEANRSILRGGLALPIPDLGDLDAMVGFLSDFLDAYHENIVVTTISSVTISDPSDPDSQMELHLYLFDDVLSIQVDETSIAFRKELKIVAEVASVALESGVLESGNLADLEGDDIRAVFETLSRSDLIATVIPLAIELASQQLEVPVELDAEELYAIPWKEEIAQLGNIAAFVFDIAAASGALTGEIDLDNLTVEGSDISELFNALADSNLITYATSVAITPLLAMVGGEVSLILSIDEDIVWADEFRAIGSIMAEVLNTGITYSDIASGDYMLILTAVSSIDFTVLLESSLIKNAIINVLSGAITVPGLELLTIPEGIDWDVELENILLAINQLASVADQIDLENIGIDSISLLSDDMIDSLFESDIIVATITTQLLTLDLGGLPIVIPDSVFDDRGYLMKEELKAIATALKLVATALICEPGTENCAAEGYDISKALTLGDEDLQTLLASEVLSASVGRLVITMGGEMLVVPASATREVLIRTSLSPVVTDTVSVVTNEEIELAFGAISVLGITDINNLQLDASILDNLEDVDNPGELDPDKVDQLFGSIILHATITDVLLTMVEETGLVVVPYFSETGEAVRYTEESIDFIATSELTNVLNAFYSLNITDFTNFELDFGLIFDNVDRLLESAILHATISNQLLTLDVDMLVVPYLDVLGNPIRVITGSGLTENTYIAKAELLAAVEALELFGITDIETIADSIDFGVIFEEGNIDIMLESAILHATISKQLFDLEVDMIVVPFYDVDDHPIRIVVGDDIETQTEYLAKSELVAAIDALGLFGITDIDSLSAELDFGPIFEDGNMAQMLESAILHATISKQLIDLEVDLIVVPYFDADGNPIRVLIGDDIAEQTTYIVKSELIEVIDALDLFGITDIDSLGADLDFGPIFEDGNMALMLDSAILHATISKQLIDLEVDLIVVPYFDVDENPIRIVVGPTVEEETIFIVKQELIEVIDALDLFGITDIDSLGADLDFGPIFEDGNMALMLDSAILHATISKQLIDLEADLIVVPFMDVDGNPIRVVIGDDVAEQTTFIVKSELIEVIDALDLFGITDIDSLGADLDFGPIFVEGNMALMLESAILHATISKQLFDLETDLIVVPYYDVDDNPIRIVVGDTVAEETTFILKQELVEVINALDLFGISDIDSLGDDFDFAPIFVAGNMALMLESAIIHATVSKQIFDLTTDLIVVPDFDGDGNPIKVTAGVELLEQTDYITKSELEYVIEALDLFGISDIDAIGDDFDFSPIFEDGNMALMLRSAIIHATVSKQILDLAVDGILFAPYFDQDSDPIRVVRGSVIDSTDTEYIVKPELTAIIDALDLLGISDIDSFDGSIDLTIVTEEGNLDILLTSAVIHATISDQLLDLSGDGIVEVPYFDELGAEIITVVGDPLDLTDTTYIIKTELQAMIDALDVLGIADINNFDGAIDLSLLSIEGNMDILLASAIIHATFSKQLFDLGGDGIINVPYFDETNVALRVSVGEALDGTDTLYLKKTELSALIDALNVLGITDVETFSGSIDLSLLAAEGNMDILLSSAIIHATISDQLLDLGDGGTINVPHFDETDTAIRVAVGDSIAGTDTLYLKKTELTALIDSLNVLGITDVETFTGSIDLSILAEEGNMAILLSSAIIHATISEQLFDLSGTIEVPYFDETGADLRIAVGVDLDNTDTLYLRKTELTALIDALNILGITDVETFDGSVDLSVLSVGDNADTVLSSSIIQATISKQIIDLGDDNIINVPHFDEEGVTIRIAVGVVLDGTDTLYLQKSELDALIDAMNILGITDVDNFDGNVDLSVLADGDNADRVLASSIIQATISDQLVDLDVSNVIVVPYEDSATDPIRVTVGVLLDGTETNYVVKTELAAIFDALDLLGITDVNTFDGNIDLTIFYTQENRDILLASAIMHATIAEQLLDLGDAILAVPYEDVDELAIRVETGPVGFETEYVVKTEISAIFETLEMLGIVDVNNFDGNIDLTLFYDPANRAILLSSAAMHATISKQLLDLGAAVLTIPHEDVDQLTIRETVGPLGLETEFVAKSEIGAIFETLEMLGIVDVNTFSGDIDLTLFYTQENRDILLDSAAMHATISKQLLDLGTAILTVPYEDAATNPIRLSVGPLTLETEFVVKSEIDAIFETLEMLGIDDIATFDGDIDLTLFYTQENRDILLGSAAMHATISKQLLDLGAAILTVPYEDAASNPIRLSVGPLTLETEFVVKSEIDAIFETLEMLGITDINTFDGNIDLTLFYTQGNRDILLASAAMHATVSKQLLDLGAAILSVPYEDVDSNAIRLSVGPVGFEVEFVAKAEIGAIFETMEMLGIVDINTFAGDIDLTLFYTQGNRDILLASAAMHATISKQLLDLGPAILTVPYEDVDADAIRLSVGPLTLETEFVVKSEIDAIFETMEMLGIDDINTFAGDIDLTLFYTTENRAILLGSAAMHATVSKQLLDLGAAVLSIPYVDAILTPIRLTVGPLANQTEFVQKAEIEAIFETLEMLGITDIGSFDGAIDLNLFYEQGNRDILLASAAMHATVSKQLIDLGDAVLRVPSQDAAAQVVKLTVGDLGKQTTYVTKVEISNIFEALEILGITDITTFDGAVDLSLFYSEGNQNTLLASASMHATISKQIRDLGAAVLLVPNQAVDTTAILLTVGGTEYITKIEIKAIFEALEILGITDITTFDGAVNLALFYDGGNQDILLASASMHATISMQIRDLGDAVLLVPDDDILGNDVLLTVDGTEFMTKAEVKALFEALEILGITDIATFDGSVDLASFYSDGNQNTLLASASMHATISKQMLDLGDAVLRVPSKDIDSNDIRVTVTAVEFIIKNEIKAIIEVLELLGVSDINNFTGAVTLTNFYNLTNQNILLASASMHATVSKQILDLGPAVLTVPSIDVLSATIRSTVAAIEFIVKDEIKAIINALEILGVTDITAFNGAVTLTNFYTEVNQNILLTSASMHATISKQMLDLGDAVLLVPSHDIASTTIRLTVGAVEFITKVEIKALIEALEILGITDITAFNGAVDLSNLYDDTKQNTLLSSASMHATISGQIFDLAATTLVLPAKDYEETSIQATVSGTDYITKVEIKALINALEVLGVTDITAFDGNFDLSDLATEADQNILLTSAAMHATIADTLLDLDSSVLIIPEYAQNGTTLIKKVVAATPFVTRSEIKALINAFLAMGYTDLDNFGAGIDSSKFFDDTDTLLLSVSIQATLSNKLLTGTGGSLIVPDDDILANPIRIIVADAIDSVNIEFIDVDEIKDLMAALDLLGMTNFASINITPALLFAADANVLFDSVSMQTTVSDLILDVASDESGAAGSLIVPDFFREALTSGGAAIEQVEKVELIALLDALETLGITNFSATVDASIITGLSDAQLDTLLVSGSMHTSMSYMIQGNANVSGSIPDLAEADAYDIVDLLTKAETKAFIKAANKLGASSFATVNFSFAAISALAPADRDIVLSSMIVRNIITPDIVSAVSAKNAANFPGGPFYTIDNSDYEESNPTLFLTKQGALDAIAFINS